MGIASFFLKCRRVWRALKKPTKKEFWTIAKVSGAGVLVLGVFGFAISFVIKFLT